MGKYKYQFGVSTGCAESDRTKEIDLIEDWRFNEAELDGMNGAAFSYFMHKRLNDFVVAHVHAWANPLDGGRDW